MITAKFCKRSNLIVMINDPTIIPRVGELVDVFSIVYEVKNIVWRIGINGTVIEIQVD